MADEIKKSGEKTIRISPNDLITVDTDLYRRMSAARSPYSRSDFFKAFKFNHESDNLISELNDEKHSKLRTKMAAGYSGKENLMMEQDMDACILDLISLIDTKYKSSSANCVPVDFARIVNFFTLDVITKLAFGKAFGYLATDSDVYSWMETIEQNLPFMQLVSSIPWIGYALRHPLVIKYVFPSDRDPVGVGKVMSAAKDLVGERFGPNAKSRQDMLGSFIRHGLTQKEAESETLLQILAGSDTSAVASRATLLQIVTRPTIFNKLRNEIDTADAKGKISKPVIRDSEGKVMPYLQACIKEGLRMCPPVTGPMGKEVPAGGDIIDGRFVPAGVRVGVSIYLIGRDKEVFGDDADLYRPERWIDNSPEQIQLMERQNELIFGYGKFGCLGKGIAFVEFNKIFVELLRRFDITPIDITKPWEILDYGLQLHKGMFVRFTDRADGKRQADL
ncbi:MAG: hypothetical protein M1814_001797 [Vezdaea aestivalis]|nr:MAG: hypothetical protein M1814_001797 [Vezdaea aestivalis]